MGADAFVFLIALVSIHLGFFNLLPVPVLYGVHLMFYAIDAVRRRPVEPAVQEWAFRGALAAILALMLLVTFNDLGAFGLWKTLAVLICSSVLGRASLPCLPASTLPFRVVPFLLPLLPFSSLSPPPSFFLS